MHLERVHRRLFMRTLFMLLLLFPLVLVGCSSDSHIEGKTELHILAAASLSPVLTEMKEEFEENYPHIELVFQFASSGNLREQITRGAPADVFLSASAFDVEILHQNSHVYDSKDWLVNRLVVVTRDDRFTMDDLSSLAVEQITSITIGNPDTVPAGHYALEALLEYDVWTEVEEHVVYASDVRQALTYVETGNADAGIVYETDAMRSDQIKKQFTVDTSLHEPIIYPAALLEGTRYKEEAETFIDWLFSVESKEKFESYGFQTIE